jgi:hypothetical protein
VWFHDATERWNGAYVALRVAPKPLFGEALRDFPSVTAAGSPARLVWVGDPGVGEVAVTWRANTGDCGWHALSLSTTGMSQGQAESVITDIAGSLRNPTLMH